MRPHTFRSAASAALAVFLLAAASAARADSVRIGGLGDTANIFPFGSGSGTRYQQVYNAALFAGPMTITEIDFFNNRNSPGAYPANGGLYSIYLSTTSKAVNGLDSVMSNNIGSDNALFFQGVLNSTVPFVDGEYTMQLFGSGFTYDPSLGNLLMDVQVTGNHASSLYLDARAGSFGTDSSRMHNFGGGFESYGLVTQFKGPDPIPEPALIQLPVLLGLGGAGYWWRRRRAG